MQRKNRIMSLIDHVARICHFLLFKPAFLEAQFATPFALPISLKKIYNSSVRS